MANLPSGSPAPLKAISTSPHGYVVWQTPKSVWATVGQSFIKDRRPHSQISRSRRKTTAFAIPMSSTRKDFNPAKDAPKLHYIPDES